MIAAKAIIKCLELEKVSTVFGYPGAAICPFYDELTKSKIEHVLVRHEANAGHAASGMARINGRPAVCCATSGPGAVNLIAGIATAYMDSIPVIAITGQVCTDQIGKDVFQEADITGAAEPFVKHSYLVKDAAELPRIIKEAFYIAATGRPGPVVLDIPLDVQLVDIEFSESEYNKDVDIRGYKPSVMGNKLQIKRVVEAIQAAEKPLICVGGGSFHKNAFSIIRKIAEKADIPVINTMMGISAFPSAHPLHFGMIGMHGKAAANKALNECDLLLLLGARVNDRAVMSHDKERDMNIVHIDVDPAEIGKNLPATIPVVGDIYAVSEQIWELMEQPEQFTPKKHKEWIKQLEVYEHEADKTKSGVSTATVKKIQDNPKKCTGEKSVNPRRFIQMLNKLMPNDVIICADVGQNQIWTANNIEFTDGGRLLTSGGMGTMGYSVPAAIGAKKANPSREVIAICGDGSFQMQMMELATAVQHDINIKIIVMANNRLGMVRELQKIKYNNNITAVYLDGSPDFIKLAAAYGIDGGRLSDEKNADKALIALLSAKKPYVLVVDVDEETDSLD